MSLTAFSDDGRGALKARVKKFAFASAEKVPRDEQWCSHRIDVSSIFSLFNRQEDPQNALQRQSLNFNLPAKRYLRSSFILLPLGVLALR